MVVQDQNLTPGPHVALDPAQTAQVEEKVQDAVAKGATVQTGGKRPTFSENSPLNNGFFFEPTVISSTCVFV